MMESDALYVGKVIQTDFRNVNVSAKSTKDGMAYFLKAEITQEDFEAYSSVNLTGSCFVAQVECVEVGLPNEEKPKRPRKQLLSNEAAKKCKEPDFQLYALHCGATIYEPNGGAAASHEEIARSFILVKCGLQSRSELDTNQEAARKFGLLMADFQKWNERGN